MKTAVSIIMASQYHTQLSLERMNRTTLGLRQISATFTQTAEYSMQASGMLDKLASIQILHLYVPFLEAMASIVIQVTGDIGALETDNHVG
jgi:hypothetical protein